MNYSPATPLATFLSEFVFRQPMTNGAPLSVGRRNDYLNFLRMLRFMLRRQPVVGDLTAERLAEYREFLLLDMTPATVKNYGEMFAALCQLAGVKGVRQRGSGKKNRPLSDAPGTLWRLCIDRYFPVNVRIKSDATRAHYRTALCDLKEAVGREPTLADLDDEAIARMMTMLADRGLSAESVNERRNKLRALWEWAARKKLVDQFPTIQRVKAPRRIPRAWTIDQLNRLMASCRAEPGELLLGMTAADFWTALGFLQWDTGERLGALLACRWEWIDPDSGCLLIPAEARKGQESDELYPLGGATLGVLARLKPAGQELILPWPRNMGTFYRRYERILKRAGLPFDRKSKTHRMRKSVASHLQARGHDASLAMGHSSQQVTRDSYLDPSIVGKPSLSDVLPAIGGPAEPRRLDFAGKAVSA